MPVLNILTKDPINRFSVPDMASLCGISESTLRRLFHQHFGTSPQEYRKKIRLTIGMELLRNPEISIKEAAARSGFDSPLRFSLSFKSYFGISPQEWRKRYLKKNPDPQDKK
jgi:AraC-like DNA-binding protein